MNEIDLMYLTNNLDYKKIKNKKLDPELLEDINFYKERIIQQNMNLLNGENVEQMVDNSYKRYLFLTIQHFKFIDKRDIIQKDYEGIIVKKIKGKKFNLDKTNKMLEKKKGSVGKITDSIDIKFKYKNKRKFIVPQKKIINLKDESLKTKGLKKENITNIVDNAISHNKKNDTKKKKKKAKKENKKEISKKIYK